MKMVFDDEKKCWGVQSVVSICHRTKLRTQIGAIRSYRFVVVTVVAVSGQQMLDCLIKCSLANLMPLTAALIDVTKVYIFRRRRSREITRKKMEHHELISFSKYISYGRRWSFDDSLLLREPDGSSDRTERAWLWCMLFNALPLYSPSDVIHIALADFDPKVSCCHTISRNISLSVKRRTRTSIICLRV